MPWFEPPTKDGCFDGCLIVLAIAACALFVAAVMYFAARAVA